MVKPNEPAQQSTKGRALSSEPSYSPPELAHRAPTHVVQRQFPVVNKWKWSVEEVMCLSQVRLAEFGDSSQGCSGQVTTLLFLAKFGF